MPSACASSHYLCCQTVDLLSDGAGSSRPLDGLDGAQREVATHSDRRLLLRGVAGSGKTRVIEARFRWLVRNGCAPERIAVLVPTAARAAALRARLETRLELGYEELFVLTPSQLAALVLRARSGPALRDPVESVLSAGDRLAMLVERIDELSLQHHDFGGRPNALLGGFVRRIDRLKAELVFAADYEHWAGELCDDDGDVPAALEREFAAVYAAHERMLDQAGARDDGNLVGDALSLARQDPGALRRFAHLMLDDAQELDLAPATLVQTLDLPSLTVAGDPAAGLRRYRGAGAERLASFAGLDVREVEFARSQRCPGRVWQAATAALPEGRGASPPVNGDGPAGEVEVWRCANERSQAQSVAVDIERLLAREGVRAGQIAVLVPDIGHEGQAVSVALEERAIAHRLIGEAAFFQRAEIRDVLAWLRLLADPTDAGAVVRALARPPIELRSVDIARCTQIARRRKLDMVGALAAATESPQVPPEARERIRVFLKLYRASMGALDSSRPDLYVHRLIERLGLRRQQLFAAQSDVVERLRALAAFGELAAAFVARSPQATPREFARSIAAVADFGLREQEEPDLFDASAVQVLTLAAAGGLEAEHVYVIGLHAGIARGRGRALSRSRRRCCPNGCLPIPTRAACGRCARSSTSRCLARARRLVVSYPQADDRGGVLSCAPVLEEIRAAVGAAWLDKEEELFGPAEALHSTYRLLRDELLEGTMRAGGRLGELRFDTDLDVSHAVVRYLELLKLAALIARAGGTVPERRRLPAGRQLADRSGGHRRAA